jgi:tetratricopeptide (TPR) repeat protein
MSTIDQPDCEKLNQQALQHYARQELDQAIALWRRGLEQSPNHLETHIYLAAALRGRGNNDAAARHYEQALQLQPGMPVVHYNLGNIYQEEGVLEQAAACYQAALELQPDFALAAYNLANIYRDQGRLHESVDYYTRSISSDPGHAPSYNNLGNALKYQGKLDQAVACYQKALQYQPDYADALYNLGNAFYEMQDFARAMTWFDRAGIRDAAERALYCSYKTGQFDDFRSRLDVLQATTRHHSPQVATLVAHHAVNFHTDNNYSFCPSPFDFVYHQSIPELAAPDSPLRAALLQDINHAQIDERKQGRLHHGVQSSGNLFYRSEPSFRALADLVRDQFSRYLHHYRDADCELIRAFPQAREFESSWYIRMHTGGHLTSHIHESGWVSGAVYLALPARPEGSQEGCFEVSVHGDDYPIAAGAGEFHSQLVPLAVGDIVLFPANLFHRTVPFKADQERICIAFDLKPGKPRDADIRQ